MRPFNRSRGYDATRRRDEAAQWSQQQQPPPPWSQQPLPPPWSQQPLPPPWSQQPPWNEPDDAPPDAFAPIYHLTSSLATPEADALGAPPPPLVPPSRLPPRRLRPGEAVVHIDDEPLVRAAHSRQYIRLWIGQIVQPELRSEAIQELCKIMHNSEDLAILLWNKSGVVSALLEELVFGQTLIESTRTTDQHLSQLHHVLKLMECLALEPVIRSEFMRQKLVNFVKPFVFSVDPNFENAKLLSFGVIFALFQPVAEHNVIMHVLENDLIRACLSCLMIGVGIAKDMSLHMLYEVLNDETGLQFMCETYERFFQLSTILKNMVLMLEKQENIKQLKYIIKCYKCLAKNERVNEALQTVVPNIVKSILGFTYIHKDNSINMSLITLLQSFEVAPRVNE